jgi:hypothetical protein
MTDEGAKPAGVHALADMFFTLGAMALLAIAICAGAASSSTAVAGLELKTSHEGVTYEGRMAPFGNLLDDVPLRERLAQARARAEVITVVIGADGLESAFVLESLLGGMQVRQRRSTEALAPTRGRGDDATVGRSARGYFDEFLRRLCSHADRGVDRRRLQSAL